MGDAKFYSWLYQRYGLHENINDNDIYQRKYHVDFLLFI